MSSKKEVLRKKAQDEEREQRRRWRGLLQPEAPIPSRRDQPRENDEFMDNMRNQEGNVDIDIPTPASSLPRREDGFQPSHHLSRSPAMSPQQIQALVNNIRKSTPLVHASLPQSSQSRRQSPSLSLPEPYMSLQGEVAHSDNDEEEEEGDAFQHVPSEVYVPPRDIPSSASNEHMRPPSYPLRRQNAGQFTNPSPWDTSNHASFTPHSQASHEYMRAQAMEQQMKMMMEKMAKMERQLEQASNADRAKDEVIASLLQQQQKKRSEEESIRADMRADPRDLIRRAALDSKRQPSSSTSSSILASINAPEPNKGGSMRSSPALQALPDKFPGRISPHQFPSLSPSGSPSLVVAAPVKAEPLVPKMKAEPVDYVAPPHNEAVGKSDYDEEERKGDTHEIDSKKRVNMKVKGGGDSTDSGGLPGDSDVEELDLSDDEAIMRRNDRNPDPIIHIPEEEDETHLNNYVKWAELRQYLFPYEKNPRLYKTRFSLLSERDRKNEWMRFGCTVHFKPALFGHVARRWFENYMATQGVPIKNMKSDRPMRGVKVDKPPFDVPEMVFDPRDEVDHEAITDPTDEDLEDHNFTFENLPEAIRNRPPVRECEPSHNMNIIQVVHRYARQYRMKQIATLSATESATGPTKSQTVDTSEDAHPCVRCKKTTLYGPIKHVCSTCEQEMAVERETGIANGYLPKLIPPGPVTNTESVPSIATPTYKASSMNSSGSQPMGSPVKAESSQSKTGGSTFRVEMAPYTEANRYAEPQARVKSEQMKLTYEEQEQELTIIQSKTKAVVKSVTTTDEDKEEEDASPLGNILSYVFQPQERAMQRVMRLTDTGLHTFRDRTAAVNTAVTSLSQLGKFDGSVAAAPKYLHALCTQVQTYGFVEREIINIMDRTMTGNASTWLASNKYECFNVKYKPLQVLLHRFRNQYLGPHVTRDLRKQMSSTILTTPNPQVKDLDTHYNAYESLVSRLRMSDKFVDDDETKTEFFTSLPKSLKDFIGNDVFKARTPHDVYEMAIKALMMTAPRTGVKQDGDLPRVETITVNAMPTGTKTNGQPGLKGVTPKTSPTSTSEDHNKKNGQCYHCGDRGHWTAECSLGIKGQPQTFKGQAAYAEYCMKRGGAWPYSYQWWVDRAKRYNQAQTGPAQDRQASPRRSNKKKPARQTVINIDGDPKAAEVIDDDDE
jgi:hypothetical protein